MQAALTSIKQTWQSEQLKWEAGSHLARGFWGEFWKFQTDIFSSNCNDLLNHQKQQRLKTFEWQALFVPKSSHQQKHKIPSSLFMFKSIAVPDLAFLFYTGLLIHLHISSLRERPQEVSVKSNFPSSLLLIRGSRWLRAQEVAFDVWVKSVPIASQITALKL